MFCIKICFFGAEARAFVGGARTETFYLEPVPESNKKMSGAGAKEKWLGSATL